MIKTNIKDRRHRSEKYKRVIKLVSAGFVNPSAFPNGGEITVLPWDSSIDNWLGENATTRTGTDRDRLLFDLMAKVCNLNGCPLEDFALGDVNTVLMVSRSISEMNKIKYVTTCPECTHEEIDEIVVPDELKPIGAKTADYPGFDTLTLDECKDVVQVRPLRVRDTLAILGRAPEVKAKLDDNLAHSIAPIVSINDSAPERIEELVEWYGWLHPHDTKQLETFVDLCTPHLSTKITHECGNPACKKLYEHKLTIDQDFFRSGCMGTARRTLAANL